MYAHVQKDLHKVDKITDWTQEAWRNFSPLAQELIALFIKSVVVGGPTKSQGTIWNLLPVNDRTFSSPLSG